MQGSEWGGIEDATRELGTTRKVVLRLVERGVIPKTVAGKVGSRWRFHLPRLRALRDEGKLSYDEGLK